MISVENLSKGYGSTAALRGVTVEVDLGEILAVVGPSGCGKTTLLRVIAGFEQPDEGTVAIDGVLMSTPSKMVPPYQRTLSMIFQDLALWPHLSVREHLEFVLKRERLPKQEMRASVKGFLEDVGLNGHSDRYPHQLSGGEQQRLAIARSLSAKPTYLLMDEPFSNLDPIMRAELQELIRKLRNSFRVGILYVTHNIEEVLALADRIAFLNQGKFEQVGTKQQVVTHPRNDFVRRFLGL